MRKRHPRTHGAIKQAMEALGVIFLPDLLKHTREIFSGSVRREVLNILEESGCRRPDGRLWTMHDWSRSHLPSTLLLFHGYMSAKNSESKSRRETKDERLARQRQEAVDNVISGNPDPLADILKRAGIEA